MAFFRCPSLLDSVIRHRQDRDESTQTSDRRGRLDTEDAELIATAITLTESEDGEEILHSLYRSNDGRWFQMTRKEESASGELSAFSVTEAADWCCKHEVAPDLIARYFGAAVSDQPTLETWSLLTKKWAATGTDE
jgi:hypothetical protein